MNIRFVSLLTTVSICFLAVAGAAQTASFPQATAEQPLASQPAVEPISTGGLLIGPGDLLEVNLYDVPDFKTEVRVDSTGEVSLPLLGAVSVGGLPVRDAERVVSQKLAEKHLFNNPQVTIFVREPASQGISVLGEVQKPGIYSLLGSRRLYDAISAAGGTTPKAGAYALITHRSDPQHPVQVPLTVGGPKSVESNVAVEPGDTVVVAKGGIVYVVGDVRQPGGFVIDSDTGITVLQAIAFAQGIGPNPSLNSSRLIRKTSQGPKDISLPLKQILEAKAPDQHLQAGDILFIPGSAAKGAAKRGLEAIVQMATGVAVWRIP